MQEAAFTFTEPPPLEENVCVWLLFPGASQEFWQLGGAGPDLLSRRKQKVIRDPERV